MALDRDELNRALQEIVRKLRQLDEKEGENKVRITVEVRAFARIRMDLPAKVFDSEKTLLGAIINNYRAVDSDDIDLYELDELSPDDISHVWSHSSGTVYEA